MRDFERENIKKSYYSCEFQEYCRPDYIQALFPFLLIDQSEIFIKILLHEPHLIASLERGFVEHVIREMDKNKSNAGIGILYDHIKSLFNNARAVSANTGQALASG